MKTFFAFVVFCAATMAARAENPDQLFRQANENYAAGDFRRAISAYENLAQRGEWSANLFYDLGNAYDRADDFGRAILNYERALVLEPNHPETKTNLRLAREQAQALEMVSPAWSNKIAAVNGNVLAIVTAVFFWGALLLLFWRPRGGILFLAGAALMVAIVCGAVIYLLGEREEGRAIVTGASVEARVATADSAKSVVALPAGSEVKILQRRGEWSYAALPNGGRGWIPAKAAEVIRL